MRTTSAFADAVPSVLPPHLAAFSEKGLALISYYALDGRGFTDYGKIRGRSGKGRRAGVRALRYRVPMSRWPDRLILVIMRVRIISLTEEPHTCGFARRLSRRREETSGRFHFRLSSTT